MRQVNRDELIFNLTFALKQASPSLLKQLSAKEDEKRREARVAVAHQLVGVLDRYEILSSSPPPPDMGHVARGRG